MVEYRFKWTVTRANADSMKKSTVKQEVVQLGRLELYDGKVTDYLYFIKDNEPGRSKGALVSKKDWYIAKKQWDKDGALNLLTLDVDRNGRKIDGTPDTVIKQMPNTALDGKQFSASDRPGYTKLSGKNLVGVSIYYTFRVTTTLQGTKDIPAVFKMTIEVNKVNGTWQKTTGKTDPPLPKTWP
jgi:hypothetical protein